MTRGPTIPVETCLRCGNETAAKRRDRGVRHRVQIVDSPDDRSGDVLWGQLCPACWTGMKQFLEGACQDEVTVPPVRGQVAAE